METVPFNPLLQVTPELVKKARELYNVANDAKQFDEAANAVMEWIQKEDHLVEGSKYLTREYLERVYVSCEGSIEKMKDKIDKVFTVKSLFPELFSYKPINEFEKLFETVYHAVLPKVNLKDSTRVVVTQFVDAKLEHLSLVNYAFIVANYRMYQDYSLGDHYIIDLKNVKSFTFLAQVNPILLKKCEVIARKVFNVKMKGIHLMNAPPFVDKLVFLLKQALSEKVGSRLLVHSSNADLHKFIDKAILPKDYDGDEASCAELHQKWKALFSSEEIIELMKNDNKMVSDESKRQSSTFNQEYMGMPGSFRQLNVD